MTATGADDRTARSAMRDLARVYPFLEWGVLVHPDKAGTPRFPSREWLDGLVGDTWPNANLAMHVCGPWARDLWSGDTRLLAELREYLPNFRRVQLNFHAGRVDLDEVVARRVLGRLAREPQAWLFQIAGDRSPHFDLAIESGLAAFALYDASGGRGRSPGSWPPPLGRLTGYAGGLSPDNIERELDRIAAVAGNAEVWIDMENGVRTADQFDLDKVADIAARVQLWTEIYAS